jgi:hypothetical protein
MEWVHANALMAKLYAHGVFGEVSEGSSITQLRWCFEMNRRRQEPWEHDYDIMAASQLIPWNGQNIFKCIIYEPCDDVDSDSKDSNPDPDPDPNDRDDWWLSDKLKHNSMKLRSIERWRFWKTCFEEVHRSPRYLEECRQLSARAADLMGSIERSMWFPENDNEKSTEIKEKEEAAGESEFEKIG